MAELKTKPTTQDVTAFLDAWATGEKRADCDTLLALMQRVTKAPPVMWGPSIVGFGRYHYVYESGREGDMCLTGFSPRKGAFSIYIMGESEQQQALLARLGPHRMGTSCLYVKRLRNVDLGVLEALVQESVRATRARYGSPAAT